MMFCLIGIFGINDTSNSNCLIRFFLCCCVTVPHFTGDDLIVSDKFVLSFFCNEQAVTYLKFLKTLIDIVSSSNGMKLVK